jgi:predicted nucleic acid-binding protein
VILYLETSRLVKLYFEEEGSAETFALVKEADAAAVSVIAYPEARAAFARKRIEQRVGDPEYRRLRQDFDRDWERMFVLEAGRRMIREAGDLAEKHGLRGFDAIHLASALVLRPGGKTASPAGPVFFCTADKKLRASAAAEGLTVEV